ncbi:RNA exonuclease 4 isoform X1 [Lingula anatina]|uniref:RNA exonuclease 4 n=2 Tax=Lingula anatina TaxID=7574 RepID=A0A1S3H7Z4_LINAN|nr:RNA exonuclease 4 isoform X1 [Lingula anatina]|eukprot:XP_013381244.1 RNA exonuclease 4 isoform X1 [Lingula anatina]
MCVYFTYLDKILLFIMTTMPKKRKHSEQPDAINTKRQKIHNKGNSTTKIKSKLKDAHKTKKLTPTSIEVKEQRTSLQFENKGQNSSFNSKSHIDHMNVKKKNHKKTFKTNVKKQQSCDKATSDSRGSLLTSDSVKHNTGIGNENVQKKVQAGTNVHLKRKLKHRRMKWKKKRRETEEVKETKLIQPVSRVPKKAHQASANWKQLVAKLEVEKKNDPNRKKKNKFGKRHTKGDREMGQEGQEQSSNKEPDIWFDDVDEIFLEANRGKVSSSSKIDPLVKPESYQGLTKVLAMDCEMVGVGAGGKDSILARVSIVNQYGQCVLDKYVTPTEEVTDYRTAVSGIRKEDLLQQGEDFKSVQEDVGKILKGRVVVGHAIMNDFKVLYLDHPKKQIRDTSRYKPFRKLFNGKTPSLKKLTDKLLGVKVQEGEHNSVQDAQAAMRIYTMTRKQWERDIKERKNVLGKMQ